MELFCQLSNFLSKGIISHSLYLSFLHYRKTGLCQNKQRELLVAILKAKDYGLIKFDVPIREYEYSDYHTS